MAMAKRAFIVSPVRDDKAGVFYSESDIVGLHVEAATLDEFEAMVLDVAPELVIENHLKPELGTLSLRELIPSIVINRPQAATV